MISCHPVWWPLWNAFCGLSLSHEGKYLKRKNNPKRKKKRVLPGNISDSGRRQGMLKTGLVFSEVQSAGWAHGPLNGKISDYSSIHAVFLWGVSGQFNTPGLLHNSFSQTYKPTNEGGEKALKYGKSQPKMWFLMQNQCTWCSDVPDHLLTSHCLHSQSLVLPFYVFSKGMTVSWFCTGLLRVLFCNFGEDQYPTRKEH